MKIINITPGIIAIPPNGWGAVEKIIWDYHTEWTRLGIKSEIKYLSDTTYNDSTVVHVHVANLANMCHDRNIPYVFTIHDHHAFLYGRDSQCFRDNLKAIENSIISLSPCKYLVDFFGNKKLRYFSHAVNTDTFVNKKYTVPNDKILCVANNGYSHDQSVDRKGFAIAIEAAMRLDLQITIAGPKNNKNFFDILSPELNNYKKLTKLYDLNEADLVELYNNNSIFLHLSELEAGHPNLTLLEAMACGLPVVGTFESPKYKGMYVVERSVECAVVGISEVIKNYNQYKLAAEENAKENSYANKVVEMADIYNEYKEKIFSNKILHNYKNCNKSHREAENNISITFNDGPKVEITGPVEKKYKIRFVDSKTSECIHEAQIYNNMWTVASRRYFIKWKIEIFEMFVDGTESLVKEYILNLRNRRVKIVLDTESLGDLIAFVEPVSEFQKQHQANVDCVVYNAALRNIFKKSYTNINFLDVNGSGDEYFATYWIGYFNDWADRITNDPRTISLTAVPGTILGIGTMELRPNLSFHKKVRDSAQKKYVCICTQSTAQCKYWNNPNGWKTLIAYLNGLGMEVWCIDLHNNYGSNVMNQMPVGAIDKTGELSLEERMAQIEGAEFFVGLGSGMSWLAWAVGKPVILISGFSQRWAEFFTPHRIINDDFFNPRRLFDKFPCHGCWNDPSCRFDKGDWMWCPRGKDFECTKSIKPEQVIEHVNQIINKKDNPEFDYNPQPTWSKYLLHRELLEDTSIYEKLFQVEPGDVVMDVGAHVGAFCQSIKPHSPSKIFAVEPSQLRGNTLKRNLKDVNAVIINKGILDTVKTIPGGLLFDGIVEDLHCTTFRNIIDEHHISKIDFLKLDCEGGEYDIINLENIEWIKANVSKISGEWHLHGPALREKFRSFRDNILVNFKTYYVYSVDNVDIKWSLFSEDFLQRYTDIHLYIDNRTP
jgi:autotransporter strand-loop-strand O-heptosyltransferase